VSCLQHIRGAAAGGEGWVAVQLQLESSKPTASPASALPAVEISQTFPAKAAFGYAGLAPQQEQPLCTELGVSSPCGALAEWAKQPVAQHQQEGGAGGSSSPCTPQVGPQQVPARAFEVEAPNRASLARLGCKQDHCEVAAVEGVTVQAS
jgi:hypothetical protein